MKKSTIFWNSVVIIILIAVFFINKIAFISLEVILMCIFGGCGLHNMMSYSDRDKISPAFFFWLNPIGLIALGVIGIIWLINNPINKFNTWLDTEKEKKMKFKEFKNKENK